MEIRLWLFVIITIFCIGYGYFTDIYGSGIRIHCNFFVHDCLFLKKDGRKKLMAVVLYQLYIEIITIVYVIRLFLSSKWTYADLIKEWFHFIQFGILGLIVCAGLMAMVKKFIKRYPKRGGK